MTALSKAAFIEVEAGVRYWEDAIVNGEPDDHGLIFGRDGDAWKVRIDLAEGRIVGWPPGWTAQIHYKVCDDGRYWLLDAAGARIASRDGYVPDDFLCHGNDGYGDYIILNVGADGLIAAYARPVADPDDWTQIDQPAAVTVEGKLEVIVRKFMADHKITFEEMIFDTDNIAVEATTLIAELCAVVGYPDEEAA